MRKQFASLLAIGGILAGISLNTGVDAFEVSRETSSQDSFLGYVEKSSGLKYKDVMVGDGKEAKQGMNIKVHYEGTLYPTGQKFDSSFDRGQPASFKLAKGQVIQGWVEGVSGMKTGGRRTLIIPANLGYGEQGYPGVIPPNATLKFDVVLLDVEEVSKKRKK